MKNLPDRIKRLNRPRPLTTSDIIRKLLQRIDDMYTERDQALGRTPPPPKPEPEPVANQEQPPGRTLELTIKFEQALRRMKGE